MLELHPLFNTAKIPVFNIMTAIGFILSLFLLWHNIKIIADSKRRKEDLSIYLGISFLIGIALSNIVNWFIFPEFSNKPLFYKIMNAGYTFYFGLIVFLLAIYFFLKILNYDVNLYMNEIVPSIILFHAIGRVGCLLGGCCYGKICNLNLFFFSIERYPTRELSIIFLFSLTFIFQRYIKHKRLMIYLIIYPIFRFLIEFKRGDNRGHLITDILSPSQEISLIIIFVVIMTTFYIYLKNNILIQHN